jgi:DNA-binding transcriptional ArsR family regulator
MDGVPELAKRCAGIHRVLANSRRLMILWALAGQELSVGDIALAIGASLQSTSQHLRLMRDHSLLRSRRVGQSVLYRLHEPERLPVSVWPMSQQLEARPEQPESSQRHQEISNDR